MAELGDKLQTPFSNLLVAKEYLETAQSDAQWRDTEDRATISFAC